MKHPEDPIGAVAALDEPTRRRLYDYVVGSREPVGRDQAATAVGIPRVTAAFHLDRLVAQGLLEVSHRRLTGRTGPGAGRPAKLYHRGGADLTVSLPPRHYDLAGELLAAAVEQAEDAGVSPREALADRAYAYGRDLAESAPDARDPVATLAAYGFEPYDDHGRIRLANCPFHRLARSHTELVCGMNLHLVGGLLSASPDAPFTAELDPGDDRCCVALRPVE